MRAEIIAVGSELLLGDVINSNAAWISRELAELGVDVYFHITVGDNPGRLRQVVAEAAARSDVLIFTGGLGPTDDDLTVATLAECFHTPLETDPDSEQALHAFFKRRGIFMAPSNLKQALKPQGAKVITNPIGTAPGVAWDVSRHMDKPTCLLAFPGVPKELYAMWPQGRDFIRQQQAARNERQQVLVTRYLYFFGISESRLGELLRDLMTQANPTVAPYVGQAEIKIRVAAKADSPEAAEALIAPTVQEILARCRPYYYGSDTDTLESSIAQQLHHNQLTLGVAESCTGGLISSRLTDVPGSSAYTLLNVITYGNAEKTRLLGVSEDTLARVGAVSPEVAAEMALGIRRVSGCQIGLAITGIAGPDGGTPDKPVGLAYVGICGADGLNTLQVKSVRVNPQYARQDIKHRFSQYALHYLLQAMRGTLDDTEHWESPEPSTQACLDA